MTKATETCRRCGKTVGTSEHDIHTCTPVLVTAEKPIDLVNTHKEYNNEKI